MFEYTNKIIGIFNQKGGVGKTTVGTIVAEYLALVKHRRVLVVDTDMQCNSSEYWVGMEYSPDDVGAQIPPVHPEYDGHPDINERSTIADIYNGKSVVPYSTYLDGESHGAGVVDVLLGHPKLIEDINTTFESPSGEIQKSARDQLGSMLHDEIIGEEYDVIIIDTGPSRSALFRAALHAATFAIIPYEPEPKSLQGINAMLQAILSENYTRTEGDDLRIIGIIPNKVRKTILHAETITAIRSTRDGQAAPDNVYLPQAVAFPERDVVSASPKSIFNLPETSVARVQSEILGEWVDQQVFGVGIDSAGEPITATRGVG